MKRIPHLLSMSRIVLCLPLLMVDAMTMPFWTLYVTAGMTDMLDGFLARRWGVESKFGARLDSLADFVFVMVIGYKLFPYLKLPTALWMMIGLIALVKTVNAISSYVVRHRIEYLHTKANRLTGFLLFVCVMTIGQPYFVPVAWGIACIALFAAIQEGHFIRSKQDIYTEWTDFNFYEYNNMKHEIIELHNVQMIGMAKKIAFNEAKEECPKFWGEYVEKIIKPVIFEKKEPNTFQKAAFDNGVGEFGLCTCDIPNHNCASCAEQNFGTCSKNTFTYVIGGVYKGGDVPEGMQLFPIHSGKWLKMHFEGGMKAFQEQYEKFHKEWLPAHPEYKWVLDSCCMEWYHGTDIQSPDYQCGVMMPLED